MMRGPDNANKLASLMTKREAIAAQILAGILSNPVSGTGDNNPEYWQREAIKQTDGLLKILAEDESDA